MATKIGRREFMSKGAKLGVSAVLGERILSGLTDGPKAAWAKAAVDVAVVTGADYAAMTAKAVELVGGMGSFVPKNARVVLLPNVQSKNPWTFTKPEILRTVIRMCKSAGAGEVACLSYLGQPNWDGTGLAQVIKEEGAVLKLIPREDANFKTVPVPNAAALKEAMVMNEFHNYDVFINMPITKDHAGTKFTGTLKNLMGLNAPTNNRGQFHKPNWQTDPVAIEHLETCIVDLNMVIKPALNIVDATEIIRTNGPMGPGELIKPGKVIAGMDRVAVDAYCATVLGLKGPEIIQIRKAWERKLGEMDLNKVKVVEAKA
ncbi:MAG: DUF362 domain-containing protein [Candidatus Aminicenantes bacterium]|nr:DUF362 domain-containing protein [Candidatus Aminicenantes bacterium]